MESVTVGRWSAFASGGKTRYLSAGSHCPEAGLRNSQPPCGCTIARHECQRRCHELKQSAPSKVEADLRRLRLECPERKHPVSFN
eukprot:262202-Rhodomonas_salina.3